MKEFYFWFIKKKKKKKSNFLKHPEKGRHLTKRLSNRGVSKYTGRSRRQRQLNKIEVPLDSDSIIRTVPDKYYYHHPESESVLQFAL